MRHRSISLIGIIVLGSLLHIHSAYATGWVAVTSPVTEGLFGLDCASSDSCIAVGDNGTVISSSSDRTTWTEGASGVATTLNDVHYYSSTAAYAVGDKNVIIKSTDGGTTWSTLEWGGVYPLYDVQMVSATVGWAVGEHNLIYKTTDGGTTWTDVGTTAPTIDAFSVDAINSSIVWVAGFNGAVIKSTDGGTTWTNIALPVTGDIYTLELFTNSMAFVGGENGLLYKTTNGGTTWTALTLTGFASLEGVADIGMKTTSVGSIVGNLGTIASTVDGVTFTEDTVYSPISGVYDLSVYANSARMAVGASGGILAYDAQGPNVPEDFSMDDGASTTDTTPRFSWSESTDNLSDVDAYEINIDSTGWVATTAFSYHIASSLSVGSHTASLRVTDAADNTTETDTISFTVTSASSSTDTTAPSVGSVSPTTATEDAALTLSATYSDASTVSSCTLYVNGSNLGSMTLSSGTARKTYTFVSDGSYSSYVGCTDAYGNVGVGTTTTIVVADVDAADPDVASDTTDPTVGAITPSTATEDEEVTLRATASDDVDLDYCKLYVSSAFIGYMTVSGGYASYDYTFTTSGTKSVNAYCVDEAGNATRGATTSVVVSSHESTTDDEATEGDLMKMACSEDADVNDPCRAVYYYGGDGKRHAFPNENVYFTWYNNFDDVVIVTDDFMASVTLGRNVTYHPGTTMVKFITVNTVYAVGEEGELRAIDSEDTAVSIWGSNWNTMIDDISDAFYSNYTFGEDIDSTSDYDPDDAEDSVRSIDEIL